MKHPIKLIPLLALAVSGLILTAAAQGQTAPSESGILAPASATKDLYPAGANATKEIEVAVKQAASDHKRVLLVFGGNWCYDCHVLDQALHQGAAGKILKDSFLLVHVDIGEANKNLDLTRKYKIPLEKGVPAVAVLNGEGELLYSSGDGEFEAARVMMKKDLIAFLRQWQEAKAPAAVTK